MSARPSPLVPGAGGGSPRRREPFRPPARGEDASTLALMRDLRRELASLGTQLSRMTDELSALRAGVEAVAAQRPAPAETPSDAALAARVEKLERRVRKLRREAAWKG